MVANAAEGDKVAGKLLCNVISDTIKLFVAYLALKNVRSLCTYLSCSPTFSTRFRGKSYSK